jgi:RNA polymerase sigma-70 factor (ECF subfamily)
MQSANGDFPELVARVRRGDEAAVAELVRRYEPEVRRVAHARIGPALRPHLDSMDLVQSIHRSLLLGLRQGRFDVKTPENLVALAVTLVQRKVARIWRRLQGQPGVINGSANAESILLRLPGKDEDPARIVEQDEQVRRLLDSLPELDRRLIELRLEGCTTAEAARALDMSPDVLRVRLQRLRERLRESKLLTDSL